MNIDRPSRAPSGVANAGTIEDSIVNTGDFENTGNLAVGNDGPVQQTRATSPPEDGGAATVFGDAETTGSGNDFGEGSQGNVQAASDVSGDVNQQSNQADVDIDVTGTGGAGGAGGAGGSADGEGGGGTGGAVALAARAEMASTTRPITVTVDQDNTADVDPVV